MSAGDFPVISMPGMLPASIFIAGLSAGLAFMPGIVDMSIPAMLVSLLLGDDMSMPDIPSMDIPFMPAISPIPISVMVRMGLGSIAGMLAARPARVASVARAYPLRSCACAKIV